METDQMAAQTTAVALSPPTRIDVFIGEVLPPDRMNVLVQTLPAHVKPERFQRNLFIAVAQHPKLLNCHPAAVFNEVSKAAALGLYLDPQLGEAYLITGMSNGSVVPQLRLGYRGLIKLGRQSGDVADVYAHEVHANDRFECVLGDNKRLTHTPDFMADRGSVVLYYAVVKFRDGHSDFEPMNVAAIHRIRDRSDGWRAYKAGRIKSTPWQTDEEEMAKKTVIRRLMKRIPQSPELAEAFRIEDADFREGPEPAPRLTLVERLRARGTSSSEGFSPEHVEREIGGGIEDDNEDGVIDGEASAAADLGDDGFPGDQPPSDAFDVLAWASDLNRRLPTFTDVDVMREEWAAHKAELHEKSPGLFRQLNAAVASRAAEIAGA
jgi:recombination protein RecT